MSKSIITASQISGSLVGTGSFGTLTVQDVTPKAFGLTIANNVNSGFSSYTDYQILLHDTGAVNTSYGIGIRSNHMVFNSDNSYDFRKDNSTLFRATGDALIVNTDISSSVASTGSFGALRVEAEEDGTTITTDRFGLTIDGQVGFYPLTVQSPYETAARFISTDGTANIEIGDNSSTQNHNRIQVRGDLMELVAANSKRVELSSGAVVINQDSDDVNFRVETNNDNHALFIDGGKDSVSIGSNAADNNNHEKLTVAGNVGITGSLHVSGNITTSGSIIAKEFRTEFVNQIIATSSGSTEFGDSIDDTHDFTGSIEVSGTLNIPTGSITVEGGIGGANIARFSRNQGTQRTDIDIHAGSGDPQHTLSSPSGRDYSIGQDISENTFVISEHTGVGTEDRLIVRDDGDVFISQSLDFRAEHAADKIVLYNGGSEKIGTSAHTMILTAT